MFESRNARADAASLPVSTPASTTPCPAAEISRFEANHWWRRNEPVGALLNNLIVLFILAPIGLVLKDQYVLSVVVFSMMVPYGFLMRRLAAYAAQKHLSDHPEAEDEFRRAGIIP